MFKLNTCAGVVLMLLAGARISEAQQPRKTEPLPEYSRLERETINPTATPNITATLFPLMPHETQLTDLTAPRGASGSWGNPNDHRWEGFAFGAGTLGSMMGLMVHDMCSDSSNRRNCTLSTFGGFLFGANIGGVVGGFIGKTIPKKHKD